jgi:hypothetical protein
MRMVNIFQSPCALVLHHGGKAYTEAAPNCTKSTLQGIIRGKADLKILYILMTGVYTLALDMFENNSLFKSRFKTNIALN